MIKQFLHIALRNFLRDKLFSFVNLTNLIVGFGTFILISLFIKDELSWDKHNENYDRIYRLQTFMDQEDNSIRHTWSVTAALSRHELTEIPEIEKIALMHDVGDVNKSGVFLSVDKINQFPFRYGFFSDPSVFDIFTFNFIEGDKTTALKDPYSIVLSNTVAKKLFPEGTAVGKQVFLENKVAFTVCGIFKDLPVSSTFNPTYLIPMKPYEQITNNKGYENNYMGYSFYTYVLLHENADPSAVDDMIKFALIDYRKEHSPYLRPLSKLHINPHFENGLNIAIALFSIIALFILLLSSINYVNLQTANASSRLREIGVKKTLGFTKKNLLIQFVFESVLLSFLAGIAGIMAAQSALPGFNYIIGAAIPINVFNDMSLVGIIILITLITGLLSGLYPAVIISSFNPIQALKQKFIREKSGTLSLKNILVTIQFSISLCVLIVSFIFFKQTSYLMHKELGFDSENLVYSNIITDKKGSFDQLRQRLINHPEITNACFSDYIPFILPGGDDLSWEGASDEEKVFIRKYNISYDFLSTYNMKIIEGRNFSRDFPTDIDKCLINETAVRIFGWDNPIGKHIHNKNKDVEIIGVIRDFIPNSAHNAIEPHMYRLIKDTLSLNGEYTVRFSPGKEQQAMKIIKTEFEQIFPDDAFEFVNFEFLIQNDPGIIAWKKFSRISVFFAMLSIIISSIGLFGLVMLVAKRKMKEIGIRKVFGFSKSSLYLTLSSGFVKLILISIFLAWPAGFYMYTILPGTNRYPVQIWEFLLATGIIVIISLMTISYQILKASKMNPVEILKYE